MSRPRAMPRDDRVGDLVGRHRERRRLHALGHLRVHEAGAHDHHVHAARRERRRPGPGSSRRRRPSTIRTRSSSAARVRRPPTTAARTCRGPGRAAGRRAEPMTETVPVKFVCTMSSAAAGSCSARAWSPSTPNATSTRSKSPKRSNVVRTNPSCEAKSVASNATACDLRRAGRAQRGHGRVARLGLARREHDPRAAAGDDLAHGRERDVGGPAEHEHRLHFAQRVLHADPSFTVARRPAPLRSSRRSMSLRSRLSGSSVARVARHSSSRGYIAASSSGRSRSPW